MSKLYALGFFLVAGGAFGAIDFNQQAKNAGKTIETYSVATYAQTRLGSVGGVFVNFWEAKQLKQRQQKAASIHLPEAPEGWTRRAWADSDRAVYLPYVDFTMTEELAQDKQAAPTMNYAQMHETIPPLQIIANPRDENPDANFLEKSMRMPLDKMLHRDVFIYQRGEEVIALRATYDPRMDKPRSVIEWVMIASANKMKAAVGDRGDSRAFAYFGGVPFEKSKKINELEYVPPRIKVIEGRVSPKIKVEAWSMGADDSVRELLAGIDYSGLNAMLEEPLPEVANSEPLPVKEQIAEASAIFKARDKAEAEQAEAIFAKFSKAAGKKGPMGMAMGGGLQGMMTNTAAAAAAQQGIDPSAISAMTTMMEHQADLIAPPEPADRDSAQNVFGALMKTMGSANSAVNKPAPAPQKATAEDAAEEASAQPMKEPLTFNPPKNIDKQDGMRLVFTLMSRGFGPENLEIVYDGINDSAASEWQQMRGGTLPASHPGYKVRQKEVQGNLAPGSCLEMVNAKVYCGETAQELRLANHMRQQKLAKDAAKGASKGSVFGKTNNQDSRFGKLAKGGSSGGGFKDKNCETSGAFKRCTVGN